MSGKRRLGTFPAHRCGDFLVDDGLADRCQCDEGQLEVLDTERDATNTLVLWEERV